MPSNFALSCIYRSLTTAASPSSIGAKKANKAISMTSEQRSWHERDSLMMPTGTELSHTCQRPLGSGSISHGLLCTKKSPQPWNKVFELFNASRVKWKTHSLPDEFSLEPEMGQGLSPHARVTRKITNLVCVDTR